MRVETLKAGAIATRLDQEVSLVEGATALLLRQNEVFSFVRIDHSINSITQANQRITSSTALCLLQSSLNTMSESSSTQHSDSLHPTEKQFLEEVDRLTRSYAENTQPLVEKVLKDDFDGSIGECIEQLKCHIQEAEKTIALVRAGMLVRKWNIANAYALKSTSKTDKSE